MNQLLKTLLYEWKDRKLPSLIERDIHLDTTFQQGSNNATVITGFRRVGKTYLLFDAIEKLLEKHDREDVVYINFEDERILPNIDLLTDLLPEIQATFGRKPKYLFLDELQLIPNWSKWVRRVLDSEDIRIFITGSSSKMSSYELPTELRGRAWEIKVFPLNFSEFLRFKQTTIDTEKMNYVQDEKARFHYLFDEYLKFGALPAVVLTTPEKKQELLQSYFQTVVQLEIGERFQVENDVALKTLLKLLLNSSYITISKLHNSLKSMNIPVGKTTVDNYLSYIESAYFMKELYISNASVINQLQYPRKVYFVDTGFITALSTKFSANMGRLFENVVFNKLSQRHETIHYYKDDNDNEVDFVIREEEKVTGLYQVCFDLTDEETRNREVKSLVKAGATFNCQNLKLVTLDRSENISLPEAIEIVTPEKLL
ncbi:MAG TPA: ATP-binding protein [Candidatus Saccharimonadales bacterium]|nr:ATP-binding protein [Candidatus Saccharimonadales bacterium]